MEVWKPVVGFEGAYEVSSRGRVRSVDRITRHGHRRKGRPMALRPRSAADPHLAVNLCKNGKFRPYSVHHLVLEAFVGPRPARMMCRHFPDRDPTNNRIENLQWGTHAENVADREFHGTTARGDRHGKRLRRRQ